MNWPKICRVILRARNHYVISLCKLVFSPFSLVRKSNVKLSILSMLVTSHVFTREKHRAIPVKLSYPVICLTRRRSLALKWRLCQQRSDFEQIIGLTRDKLSDSCKINCLKLVNCTNTQKTVVGFTGYQGGTNFWRISKDTLPLSTEMVVGSQRWGLQDVWEIWGNQV